MTKYAYVTVMYGNNIYLTGALVLGYSLARTKTRYDRIILITPDVSSEYANYLGKMYNIVRRIEYVTVNENIFSESDTRFRDVFTKLACLELTEYEKIILLDLDMIVTRNIDHLFNLPAPAACLKRFYVPYGKRIPSDIICKNGVQTGSINAGLMLLKPDLSEWNDIKQDISHDQQIMKYKYPEQDYLSLRYCKCWTSITFNYNYQFGLTNRVKSHRYRADDIYVIHYSSRYKPWNFLQQNDLDKAEIEFRNQHKKYYDLWLYGYQKIKTGYSRDGITLPY